MIQTNRLNSVVNNSYLQSHPDVIQAGIDSLMSHANGMSSVRFICGTNVSLTAQRVFGSIYNDVVFPSRSLK